MKFTGERYVPEVEGWIAFQHYHRYYFVINQLDLKEEVVLDIACGEGYGSELLSKHSKYVYGVDVSRDVIINAQSKYRKPNLEFLVGNTSSIPLPDASVDVIVSFETIEHHDKHLEMMKEIKRVLKENGKLVISSPDKSYYENYLGTIKNDFHVKELYYEEFLSLINRHFKYFTFFIQNNVIGSLIASEEDNCTYRMPVKIDMSTGCMEIIKPRFNICIASDVKLTFHSSISFCCDNRYDDLLDIIIRQKKIIENIYNSVTWKIIRIISFPFRMLRKMFR